MRLITYVPAGEYDPAEFPPDAVRGPSEERWDMLWIPVSEQIVSATFNHGVVTVTKDWQHPLGEVLLPEGVFTILP